jgi:hypothetical protein
MIYDSQAKLTFGIKRIKGYVSVRDEVSIEKYRRELLGSLKVPSNKKMSFDKLTIVSKENSYHLLSVYLLLDIIDQFWDGDNFQNEAANKRYFLLNELSTIEEANTADFETVLPLLKKASKIIEEKLFIFLLPYKYEKPFVINEAYPGSVLLIYATDNLSRTLREGLAEFYFQTSYDFRLPKWANSEEEFVSEFFKFIDGKKTRFSEGESF